MGKRKSKKPIKESPHKLRPDVAETAFRVMQEATGERPKTRPGEGEPNPVAKERGRFGGRKGGPARDKVLSSDRKKAIAAKGGRARSRQLKGDKG